MHHAAPGRLRPLYRPAPELARQDRITAERAGEPARQPHPSTEPDPREPLAVLLDVLDRDEAEISATEYQRRELLSADHLGRLNAVWQGETSGLLRDRYRVLTASLLPPGHAASNWTSRRQRCYGAHSGPPKRPAWTPGECWTPEPLPLGCNAHL